MKALKCSVVCWRLARLAGLSGQDTLNLYQHFFSLSLWFSFLVLSQQYPPHCAWGLLGPCNTPLTVHGVCQVPEELQVLHLWGGSWFFYQFSIFFWIDQISLRCFASRLEVMQSFYSLELNIKGCKLQASLCPFLNLCFNFCSNLISILFMKLKQNLNNFI